MCELTKSVYSQTVQEVPFTRKVSFTHKVEGGSRRFDVSVTPVELFWQDSLVAGVIGELQQRLTMSHEVLEHVSESRPMLNYLANLLGDYTATTKQAESNKFKPSSAVMVHHVSLRAGRMLFRMLFRSHLSISCD